MSGKKVGKERKKAERVKKTDKNRDVSTGKRRNELGQKRMAKSKYISCGLWAVANANG
jgi:hypothetical protein